MAAFAPDLAHSLPQSLKEQGVVDHAFVLECHEHKHHEQISGAMLTGMDDQLLEIFGRHRLIESLLKAGLEVAVPARDRGVDLIAYSDTDVRLGRFVGIPIQMKAASKACFSIDKKYSKFHDMLVAYVWNVLDPSNTHIYVLTQEEAVRVANEMNYTATDSWINT